MLVQACPGFFPDFSSFQVPGEHAGPLTAFPGGAGPPFPPRTWSLGGQAHRWDVGADLAEPSFEVGLNCQSCFSRLIPPPREFAWYGSEVPASQVLVPQARVGSIAMALPLDFLCLDVCPAGVFLQRNFQRQDVSFYPKTGGRKMAHIGDKNAHSTITSFPACLSLWYPPFCQPGPQVLGSLGPWLPNICSLTGFTIQPWGCTCSKTRVCM